MTYSINCNFVQVASDQAAVEKVMAGIQAELTKVDGALHNLEQQLYDAHHKLVRCPHTTKFMIRQVYKKLGLSHELNLNMDIINISLSAEVL